MKKIALGLGAIFLLFMLTVSALIVAVVVEQSASRGDDEVWSIEIDGRVDKDDKVELEVTGDVSLSMKGEKKENIITASGNGTASMMGVDDDENESSAIGQKAVDIAKRHIGNITYARSGRMNWNRLDCGRMVQFAYKEAGVNLGNIGTHRVRQGKIGTKVERKGSYGLGNAKVGDIIMRTKGGLWNGGRYAHVGLYAGNHKIIEVVESGKLRIASLKTNRWKKNGKNGGAIVLYRVKEDDGENNNRGKTGTGGIGGRKQKVKALFTSYNNTKNAMEGGDGYAAPNPLYTELTGYKATGSLRKDFWKRNIPECAIPAKGISSTYLPYGTTVTPVDVKGVSAEKKAKLESTTYLGMDCGGAITVKNGVYHFDIFYDRDGYSKNSHGTATGYAILNGSGYAEQISGSLKGEIKGEEVTFTGEIGGKPVDASGTIKEDPDKKGEYIIHASGTAGYMGASGTSTGELMWPLKGKGTIWRGWGVWTNTSGAGHYHGGLDIDQPKGSPVYASDGGVVIGTTTLANGKSLGLCVTIKHSKYITRYQHLDSYSVKKGDKVEKGQKIGTVGGSYCGSKSGCDVHLHFEVWRAKVYSKKWVKGYTYVNEYAPQWGCDESYRGATVDPLAVLPENKDMHDRDGFKKKIGKYKGGGKYGNEEQGAKFIKNWE